MNSIFVIHLKTSRMNAPLGYGSGLLKKTTVLTCVGKPHNIGAHEYFVFYYYRIWTIVILEFFGNINK